MTSSLNQAFKSREHEIVEERREAKEALNSYDAEKKRESVAAANVERENAATEAAAAKGEVQKSELPTPETAKEEDEMR